MASKITTATKEQWQQIEAIKERWIVRQTERIAFDDCLGTVHEMWAAMKEEKPIVFQVDGPIALALATRILYSQLNSQLDSQLRSQLNSQLRSQLDSQLGSQLNSQLNSQLRSQLGSQLYSQLNSQLGSQLYSQLGSQLNSQLRSQLNSQLNSQLRSQLDSQLRSQLDSQLYLSVWWGVDAGWYEGGKVLGVAYADKSYKLFLAWCERCPIVLPGKSLVLVCQNPEEIYWQNGLLHNPEGPSVRYRDGFAIYTIEGIPVDEQIVMKPETQTIEQINKEENADKKSIRINRYGWPRYLREIKAKELDSRKNEIEGTLEALYESPMGNRLVVTCPTGRIFALGTPSDVRTCEHASNWLNPHGRISKKSRVIART